MTEPDDRDLGDDVPEADVAEQHQAIDVDDEDTWQDAVRVETARDSANEADLIEQAIAVPDDDSDFDR